MHVTRAVVVATGLIFRPAAATFGYGGWGGDSHYSTPDNTDNKCSSEQAKGYDWTGLDTGSFDTYGSNNFTNWECTDSFGKRDLLTKRTFQSKCISSNLDDEPSIGCDGDESMSIDKYEVSSSEDADIECHYEMPDKTVCKEYHSCKAGGTVVQNTQCGGAKSVTFKPADGSKGKGCKIGVHSIGFNCGTASSIVPAQSKTEEIPAYAPSSPPVYATVSSEAPAETIPSYDTIASSESVTLAIPSYASDTPTAPSYDTPTEAIPSYPASTESVPSYESVVSTAPSYELLSTSPVASETVPSYDSSLGASETSPSETTASAPSYETVPSAPSYETASSAPSYESAPGYETAPSYETSTCVAGYDSSCSTATSPSSEGVPSYPTDVETSPVETPASEHTITSYPAFPIYSTGTGETTTSYNASLTYSLPAYPYSSPSVSKASLIEYTTSTIYSSTLETITSSGSTAVLTKSYAVSTTVCPVTETGKESSPVETSPALPTSYPSKETEMPSYPVETGHSTAVPYPTETTSLSLPSYPGLETGRPSSAVETGASATKVYSGPEPSSPALLPKCLNTWLYLSGCSSNSDSSCYCKHEEFINKVYGCLSAWSQSADNATNGVSYLMGICAPYIDENPAIITACPTTITPAVYTPPATSGVLSESAKLSQTSTITIQSTVQVTVTSGTAISTLPTAYTEAPPQNKEEVPCTTITYSSEITVPATYPTGESEGYTIPSSSVVSAIVTTITVPQVIITTQTVTESGSTLTTPGLGYGNPTPAATTPTAAPMTLSAPIYGSSGLIKSLPAPSQPTGIITYDGAGSILSVTNLLSVSFCVLGGMLVW